MKWISRNVRYLGRAPMTAWRKIAVGMWDPPRDPAVRAKVEVDPAPIDRFVEREWDAGRVVDHTSVLVKLIADSIALHPEMNTLLRFGTLYQRRDVNIFVHVTVDRPGAELEAVLVQNADRKTAADIHRELFEGARRIRRSGNAEHDAGKELFEKLPGFLSKPLLSLLSLVMYDLNVYSPALGVPQDGFGSASVSFMNQFAMLDEGYTNLDEHFHCPCTFVIGPRRDVPVAENGQVVVRPRFWVSIVIDHRVVDGVAAGRFGATILRMLEGLA